MGINFVREWLAYSHCRFLVRFVNAVIFCFAPRLKLVNVRLCVKLCIAGWPSAFYFASIINYTYIRGPLRIDNTAECVDNYTAKCVFFIYLFDILVESQLSLQ